MYGRGITLPVLVAMTVTHDSAVLLAVGVLVTASSAITLAAKMYFVFCSLASLALLSLPLARMARVPLKVDLHLASRATCGATTRTQGVWGLKIETLILPHQ